MSTTNTTTTAPSGAPASSTDKGTICNIKIDAATKGRADWYCGMNDCAMTELLRRALAKFLDENVPEGETL